MNLLFLAIEFTCFLFMTISGAIQMVNGNSICLIELICGIVCLYYVFNTIRSMFAINILELKDEE